MNKKVLINYIDACEVIKETEDEIRKLKKKKKAIVQGSVKGSNPDWPYEPKHFHVEGTTHTYKNDDRLRAEEKLLDEQKEAAEDAKLQVDKWMITIPFRMQRIIRYKFFHDLTWEEVATLIGRKASGDSVRMEFNNFMKK